MSNDTVIQNVFTALKNIVWHDSKTNSDYEWYYAEAMHFVVRSKKTGACWFVKAKSPYSACECVMKKIGGSNE